MNVPRNRRMLCLATLLAMPIGGCAGNDGSVVVISQGGANAMLAAARANQISMFGDLIGRESTGAMTRASMAMVQHTFTESGADFDAHGEANGRRIVFASTRHAALSDIYIKNVNGVAVTQLTSDPSSDIQPAFSPDGQKVAFSSNRSGNWDIWIISVHGGPPVQVTNNPGDDVHPSWSGDGTKLVFSTLPASGGQWELWVADAGAASLRRFIGFGLFPAWSPVDDIILFQRARQRGSRWFSIWTLTLVDGEPRYPTEVASDTKEAIIQPAWSPDGKYIAYASSAALPPMASKMGGGTNEVFDIWVMGADGRGKVRLTDGHSANFAPTFGSDGRMYFTSSRTGHENIWSLAPGPIPDAAFGPGPSTAGQDEAGDSDVESAHTVASRDDL